MSSCGFDLVLKVKESLARKAVLQCGGCDANTKVVQCHMNKYQSADGISELTEILAKVPHVAGDYTGVM